MDILNQIITTMNKEEVRHYKLFTSRTQTEGERKDLLLFDYIRKHGEQYDEEKIFHKLYKDGDKNPFYRLKNRLMSDLNKSLVLQFVDEDEILGVFHLLSLAQFFHSRSQFKVGFHYIRKAEKKALALEHYELLDFIYSEMIKLSHEFISVNPEEYIHRRKENMEKLKMMREIDDVLAAVTYRMKISLNFGSGDSIFALLEKTVADFTENPTIRKNTKLRFTLYNAVSRVLLSRKDYVTLENYLLKTYQEFSEEGLFNKSNHEVKLQMLIYLVNSLHKNRKHPQSLEYAEQLKHALEEHSKLHLKKYQFFYYNALVMNYSNTDYRKAIPLLEGLIAEKVFRDSPFYEVLLIGNLATAYYSTQQYQKAIKTLVKVFIHDGYEKAESSLKLRFGIFELLLRLETDEFDLVDKRIDKIRKEFHQNLLEVSNHSEREMLDIIGMINKSANRLTDKPLIKRVKTFLGFLSSQDPHDISFISYENWLRGKFQLQGKLEPSLSATEPT
jgi:hypothetical protein